MNFGKILTKFYSLVKIKLLFFKFLLFLGILKPFKTLNFYKSVLLKSLKIQVCSQLSQNLADTHGVIKPHDDACAVFRVLFVMINLQI